MATISATIKINDAFSGALDKLSAGLSKGQSGFQRLKTALNGNAFQGATKSSDGFFKSVTGGVVVGDLISKGTELATNGIHSMISELNEASTSWQTFEGNMHQIGRSPAQIASAKKEMQKFAQETIYGASDMSSTYSQLAAVGTKDVGRLVRGFGGLAAASSNPQQAMRTLSEQATQMAAKPKVQWQDFKLMLEQTPAGISAVAKTMGESTQQLIKDVQDGKVKTEEFLNAVAKTGTNANFTKMATQYKTVDQAMDGLKETLANGLQPQFQKLSKIGIDAISGLTDQLGNLNWDALGNGIINAINYIQPIFERLKNGISDLFEGFADSGVGDSLIDMFKDIADAVLDITNALNKGNSGGSFFKQLGKLAGGALSGAAKAISGIAQAIGQLDPDSLMALGRAFIILKGGLKGLMIMGAIKALQALNKLDPGTINSIAKALTTLALAFAMLKAVTKVMGMIKGIKDAFGSLKGLGGSKPAMPEVPKSGGILQSAGAFMKLGAALLMVGGAVALVAVGFKLIGDTATQLVSSGGAAIAVFFGMIVAIAALAAVVRLLGPGMIAASVGFLMFSAALLLIGAAIGIATAGIALLATQLPIISQYGTSAAVGILALAGAVAVFGLGAIVGAVGVLLLSVALIALGVSSLVAAVGVILLGAGLAIVAVMGLVAAVGILLLGVGLALVAATALIAAVGILMLGVGLVLVAALSLVAAVGLLLMGVGLALIAAMGIVAAVGMMLLSVSMILIAPMAMMAAVGMLLLSAALVLIGPMAMMAGSGLMVMAIAVVMLAPMVMLAATGMLMLSVALIMVAPMAMLAATGLLMMAAATMTLAAGLMAVAAAASACAAAIVAVGAAVMTMVSMFIAAGTAMVAAIRSAMQGVVSAVTSGIQAAVSAARGFAGALVGVGRDLIQGLINGITSMIGAAVSAVSKVASSVVSAAKGLLHIGSPSRLFRQYGRWVDQGLIIGLNKDAGAAALASANMAQGVVDAASGMHPTIGAPTLEKAGDPGDLLADGFDRALDSIWNVFNAITGLNGTNANVGILGQLSGMTNGENITGSNISGGGNNVLTPNSILTTQPSENTDNSQQVLIQQGAIQINSTGDADYDADKLLDRLEQKILDQADKSLS